MSIGKYITIGAISAFIGAGITYYATASYYQNQIKNLRKQIKKY